jgi:CheY-like chemotaxis protein
LLCAVEQKAPRKATLGDGGATPLARPNRNGNLVETANQEGTVHPLEAAPNPPENVTILVADDEPSFMSLLMVRLRNSVAGAELLQAIDGAEAVRLGLQRHPRIALLDVCMPRLGGIEAALTLRSLRPAMEIALQSADAEDHRVRAAELGLLLFDKRDLEQPLAWIEARAREPRALGDRSPPDEGSLLSTREQRCSRCGYRIACSTAPTRCPMCQTSSPWVPTPSAGQNFNTVTVDRST